MTTHADEFAADCMRWHKRVLTGVFAHWCMDWDFLPVDETTPDEFESCHCFTAEERASGKPKKPGPPCDCAWCLTTIRDRSLIRVTND